MTTLLYTGDVSNWNGAFERPSAKFLRHSLPVLHPFSASELECLRTAFDFLIIRGSLESPPLTSVAQTQMQSWLSTGKPTGGYLWAYGTRDPVTDVQNWVQLFDPYVNSKICWLDVEDEESFARNGIAYNQRWMLNAFQAIRDAGYIPGVYASPDSWRVITGDMLLPDDVLAWLAYWNYRGDLSVPTLGGRTVAGHQFEGAGQAPHTCGLAVDLSDFDGDIIMNSIPQQGGDPQYATEDELQRLNAGTVARFVGLGQVAPLLRSAADVIDANCSTDAPTAALVPSKALTITSAERLRDRYLARAGVSISGRAYATHATAATVNATPTTKQVVTGLLIDLLSPEVWIAVLGSLADWTAGLSHGAPITWLIVFQGIIFALLAGVRAVKALRQSTGMALVFRSAGLINNGQ